MQSLLCITRLIAIISEVNIGMFGCSQQCFLLSNVTGLGMHKCSLIPILLAIQFEPIECDHEKRNYIQYFTLLQTSVSIELQSQSWNLFEKRLIGMSRKRNALNFLGSTTVIMQVISFVHTHVCSLYISTKYGRLRLICMCILMVRIVRTAAYFNRGRPNKPDTKISHPHLRQSHLCSLTCVQQNGTRIEGLQ